MQKSINSDKLVKENILEAVIHSRRDFIKSPFSFNMFRSHPSNFLAFLSFQIHHIKQGGIAFHISTLWCHPKWSCQQWSKSTTLLGITHWIPKMVKTISHNSLAIEQCNNKCSTISSSLGGSSQFTPFETNLYVLEMSKYPPLHYFFS